MVKSIAILKPMSNQRRPSMSKGRVLSLFSSHYGNSKKASMSLSEGRIPDNMGGDFDGRGRTITESLDIRVNRRR